MEEIFTWLSDSYNRESIPAEQQHGQEVRGTQSRRPVSPRAATRQHQALSGRPPGPVLCQVPSLWQLFSCDHNYSLNINLITDKAGLIICLTVYIGVN